MKNGKVRDAADRLLKMFAAGEMPEAVSRIMTRRKEGDVRPCDDWSLGNQMLMMAQGTMDARGYKQWEKVGRYVRKGAKAIYILAPITKKVKDLDKESEQEAERVMFKGFKAMPVFRYEDTEGEEIVRPDYEPATYPPLWEAAEKLGFEVRYAPGSGEYWGSFHLVTKGITLHTHDPKTFYHELAHAVHGSFRELTGGQNPEQEIVAETAAAVLCQLQGIKGYERHNFRYIQSYCKDKGPDQVVKVMMGILADVEKIVQIVLEAAGEAAAA